MTNCSSRGLLLALDEREAVEVGTLAATLEEHPVTVSEACDELQTDGHIRQVAGGVYTITDEGRAHLERLSE